MTSISLLNTFSYSGLLILLFGVLALPILLFRYIQEGLPYNIAFSAIVGDVALMIIVIVSKEVLAQNGETSWLLDSTLYHMYYGLAVYISAVVGLIWFLYDRPKKYGDRYHHIIVAPIITFLMMTLAPVIVADGTRYQISLSISLGLLYIWTVMFDKRNNLMNQRVAIKRIWHARFPDEHI